MPFYKKDLKGKMYKISFEGRILIVKYYHTIESSVLMPEKYPERDLYVPCSFDPFECHRISGNIIKRLNITDGEIKELYYKPLYHKNYDKEAEWKTIENTLLWLQKGEVVEFKTCPNYREINKKYQEIKSYKIERFEGFEKIDIYSDVDPRNWTLLDMVGESGTPGEYQLALVDKNDEVIVRYVNRSGVNKEPFTRLDGDWLFPLKEGEKLHQIHMSSWDMSVGYGGSFTGADLAAITGIKTATGTTPVTWRERIFNTITPVKGDEDHNKYYLR